ncbi:protein DOA1 [Vairimorpha necatrix]|uniref:Protein DOA1 n=1 Tax=Vairimorpha necatrix TaxID=6039 RepID=A0AAX4JAS5_9MICR
MLELKNIINCSTKDIKDAVITDKYIITVGREELVIIYDKNDNPVGKIKSDSGNVNSVVFDGKKIIIGCQNGTICIFNIDGSERTPLYGHSGNVCNLKLRKNILLSGSWDHTLKAWDMKTLKMLYSVDHPGTVWCSDFIDDSRYVTACADKMLRIYRNNKLENTMSLHNFCVRSVIVKDNLIYSVDNEGTILKTNLNMDLLSHNSFKDFMYCIVQFKNHFICAGENGKIVILNDNLHILEEYNAPCTSCWKVFVYEDIVYVCGSDGILYIYKANDKKQEDQISNNEYYRDEFQNTNNDHEFMSDGEKYKVINNLVYKWTQNKWVLVGNQEKTYDYNLNVDLDGTIYTISLNKKDNIYEVADYFIRSNNLNPDIKNDVINLIRENVKDDKFKTYESINAEGVRRMLYNFTNIKYIYKNIENINKEDEDLIAREILWLLQNNMRFVALDLYRFFTVHGLRFDMTFLMRFSAKDKKEALAFTRLVTVLYCDPPFNLEGLFPVIQKLRDIGYLEDKDLDDYYNNRQVRKQLYSKTY